MSAGLRSSLGLGRSLVIYYGRPWRQRELARFYGQFVGPGDLAFDVGAHVGSRTRALRRAGARVVAVEPQAALARFLRWTLPHDVVLVEAAAGPRVEEAELAVSRLHPTVSSLSADFPGDAGRAAGFRRVRWDARQRVRVTTLDALIAEHGMPRFLKIDVEGFEADVLAGLSSAVESVAVEYIPAVIEVARQAVARLAALGSYRFNIVRGETASFVWSDWRAATEIDAWLLARDPAERSGDVYARLSHG